MNAIAGRGIVCWVGLSLCVAALYSQETTSEEPKKNEPQNVKDPRKVEEERSGGYSEEYVRKLMAELKARAMDFEKMQAQLQHAEAQKQKLAAELHRLRQVLGSAAAEKREMMARLGDEIQRATNPNAAQQGEEPSRPDKVRLDGPIESARRELEAAARAAAAEAMQRAANTLDNVARQAEGAASRLDQAGPDRTSNNVDESWKRLMERADVMLEKSRRNEEVAAQYLPKLESAVTQLRKAGRDQEADELMVVANTLLGRGHRSPNMPRDDVRPDNIRRDGRDPRAAGDVRQAVDELRREVEQLRGEVHELRQLLQRGKADESNRREKNDSREGNSERSERSVVEGRASQLAGVSARYTAEVLRIGEGSKSVRVGDHVKQGEPLAVLRSTDQTGTLVDFILPAPADGRIAERKLSVGEIVKPGDLLFQIEVDGSEQATELR